MEDVPPEIDMPYLPPGTVVRLSDTGEEGLVVHRWMRQEIQAPDCYVALLTGQRPDWRTDERPQILRYASTSLTLICTEE